MTDQAADGIQNMNIQDYDGSDFDPYSPQQAKMANIQSNGGTDTDLLGDSVDPEMSNGHGKGVSFHPEMSVGVSDPAYPVEGDRTGLSRQKVQRNMSAGEILGYQNEYGESITGQMEYEGYSDEEYGDNNLVDIGHASNGPPELPDPQSDQNYYMSTGQPLVDFGAENMKAGGPAVGYPALGDQFTNDTRKYSSQGYEEYEGDSLEQGDMDEGQQGGYIDEGQQGGYMGDGQQGGYMGDSCDDDETEPSSWAPERDAERARRSLSPERSVSPRDMTSQSGADIVSSPQYDTDSYADTGDISSPSEAFQHPIQSDPHSFIPASEIPGSPARAIASPQPSITESESSYADSKGSPRHKIPRPKTKKKKSIELPPWDDNVVIPPLPRMKPTLIGKQDDLPPPSSPQRPRTAPSLFTRKDASSDSGVEDDKAAKSPRKTIHESKLKRYGVDSKNQAYKPAGGNVAIFSEKVDLKTVGPRTDTTRPKSAMTPRAGSVSSDRSPSSPKPPTPNTRQAQSKIGSLNNVKHKPGGGDVTVLSSKVDFSTVKSKVGSKDKADHKPKGGDKRIEVQKLNWKAESKVGSLKNATHSPGGGNVKILDQKIEIKAQSKVGSTANLKHKPGGGDKKIETQKLEIKAQSKVGSLDKVKHKPGGGDIQILDEKVDFSEKVSSKVGSLDKIKHQPGGGDKKIETQKLSFKETAKSRTNTGVGGEKQKSRSTSRTGSICSSQDGSIQE